VLTRWYRELCPCGIYEHAVTAGFDVKESNTNLEFGGNLVFGSPYQVFNLMAGYHGKATDDWGSYNLGADMYYSPGNIGSNNTSPAFQMIRPDAAAHYFYGRAYGERRCWLPQCFELVGRVTGQVSDGNLMPTEQLGFGGYNSIRGYDMYTLARDAGYFASLEVWTPATSLVCLDDEFRALAFYDFGNAYQHSLLPGELRQVDMQGVGVGARYVARPHLEFRFDFGYQVVQVPTTIPLPRERVHLGAVLSW
jgi:hemolysin activation/secretion protein